jgi:hypothetical protein
MINNKLRRRLKCAADLLKALACDGPPIETMREAASAYSGTEHVDMASGPIGVSGGVWQVNVDAQVKLQEAAIREVAKIRKLLAELDSASEKDPRPVSDEATATARRAQQQALGDGYDTATAVVAAAMPRGVLAAVGDARLKC